MRRNRERWMRRGVVLKWRLREERTVPELQEWQRGPPAEGGVVRVAQEQLDKGTQGQGWGGVWAKILPRGTGRSGKTASGMELR